MRSRIVINIFHAHGLCISYERILRVTQGLSKVILNLSKHKKELTLRTSLLTIEVKDNIDKNPRCTISKSQYHSRKVRELHLLYTESDKIKHSTAWIPDKKATVLTDEKKEFGCLKHVASLGEFFWDTSWSVYNVRRNKADIVPYFNSIVPLLWLNVANIGTQKHCIEIVEPATILLNPEQAIIDTSD